MLADGPHARFLLMSVFDPIIVQRPARKLDPPFQGMLGIVPPPVLWFTRDDLEKAGIKPDTNLFLGVTEGTGNGHFAVRVTADDAARIGQHHPIAPASDFRALASGGVLAAEDVAVAGLARSLFAWHDSARHCGWCGTPTVAVNLNCLDGIDAHALALKANVFDGASA